jgi:hypothetical protein
MRVRAMDSNGDMTLGKPFLVDSPACVAQVAYTRCKLWQGEWFIDKTDGLLVFKPGGVLGQKATQDPNTAVRNRILTTPGVLAITDYTSTVAADNRKITINARIQTAYSKTPVALPTITLTAQG